MAAAEKDTKPREDRASTSTLEDAAKAGLLGEEVDGTPNEQYTVKGVTKK